MKKHNSSLIACEKNMYIMMLLLCFIFVLLSIIFSKKIFATDTKSLKYEEQIFYKNENPIDLDKIIQNNTTDKIKQELIVEEIDMEYTTKYKNNNELANGVIQVIQEGRIGKQNAVIIRKYENENLISEQLVAENIIKAPVERIVEIGTGNNYYNPKVKVGDTVYIVSNSASVRLNADSNSEKICTLNKNDDAKILEIEDDWYYISAARIKGYIQSNCVTTKLPESLQKLENSGVSRQELMSKLSFDMDLRNPTGMSLEQFKKVLGDDKNDKNGVFASNAEYFYYIEKQYKINGIFVASVGIHESGWGTSTIANNKKNLFGYGAVDSNPYGGAFSFGSYSEGIDMIARVFVKYYLNSKNTTIYDGASADGKFYSGSTLSAVNSRYASDKNWANGVYKWMQYLYNKI